MELRRAFDTVRRWLWLILLAGALTAVSGYLILRVQPQLYSSTATVIIGRAFRDPNPSSNEVAIGQQLAQTYGEIAGRRVVREAVMAELGLEKLPKYSVVPVENTQLLEIQVLDTDPARAQAVANQLAEQLVALSPSSDSRLSPDRRGFIEGQVEELEVNVENTEAQIADLRQRLNDMYSAREIASTNQQISALEGKLGDYQNVYASLIVLLQGGANSVQIVEPGELPEEPENSGLLRALLVVTAMGLLLGLGAAFLLDYMDDVLRLPEDVETELKLPVLGGVMQMDGSAVQDRLVTASRARSADAEAYRMVYTNLVHASSSKLLMVASASPYEGKSTTVANLALVIAQEGLRVVLVDADLRNPSLHKLFGVPNHEGLSKALHAHNQAVRSFLQPTSQEGLRLLTAGSSKTNPSILLRSDRFAELLVELVSDADLVLIDTAPVLAVTDATAVAPRVDGVVFVVDSIKTQRRSAVEAQRRLEAVNARILGVVLNRVSVRASTFHQYQQYYNLQTPDDPSAPPAPPVGKGKPRWLPGTGQGS